MIQIQSLYLNNVAGILSGTMPIDSIREVDSLARVNPDYEIPQTKEEKKFVKDFEEAGRNTTWQSWTRIRFLLTVSFSTSL